MPRYKMPEARRRRLIQAQLRRTRAPRLATIVERNIETLCEIRQQLVDSESRSDRVADWITDWCGSMAFVQLHAAWFSAWIVINLHWTPIKPFDPFPFGLLTLIVSLEAIFLSTFILISQNRLSEVADQRADLDLQINLLAEYEITRILKIVDAIADHLDLEVGRDPEVEELKHETSPREVLDEMEKKTSQVKHGPGNGKRNQ